MSYSADMNAVRNLLTEIKGLIMARPSNTVVSRVAAISSGVFTILAANNRQGYKIWNETSVVLYVKEGATASSIDYSYQLGAGLLYESPAGVEYSGIVTGCLASSTGNIQVTEYTT